MADNVIAIDGPSGAGKSSVAKQLSQELGLLYVDTGALFRSVALGLEQMKDLAVIDALDKLELNYAPRDGVLVELNGKDVSSEIRKHYVSDLASRYSAIPEVREFILRIEHQLSTRRTCVLEGRDIGTVVFPSAKLKIFLTASSGIRAGRRFQELSEAGTLGSLTLEQLEKDIEARDHRDSNRAVAPLAKAEDAYEINTDSMSMRDVLDKATQLYRLTFLGEQS